MATKIEGGPAKGAVGNAGVSGIIHDEQELAIEISRDVYEGTLRLREVGSYLPEYEFEEPADYTQRLDEAVLWNGYERTLDTLVGLVHRRKPDPEFPTDEDGEFVDEAAHVEKLSAVWENVDNAGTHGSVFSRDLMLEGYLAGYCGILVDFPRVHESRFQTRRQQIDAGLRPYWLSIPADDVLGFESIVIDGQRILGMLRYRVTNIELGEDGFTERRVTRVRRWTLTPAPSGGKEHEITIDEWSSTISKESDKVHADESDSWEQTITAEAIEGISRIPFSVFYGKRKGFLRAAPPYIDLALLNLKMYRIESDRENAIHKVCSPIPILVGVSDDESLVWGPAHAIKLPAGGEGYYMEPEGKALPESREELERISRQMATLGLQVLQDPTKANVAENTVRLQRGGSEATLAASADALRDCLELAFTFTSEWMGWDTVPTVNVNLDFDPTPAEAELINALAKMEANGQLTLRTLLSYLRNSETLPTLDVDSEIEELDKQRDEGATLPTGPFRQLEGGEEEEAGEGEGGDVEAALPAGTV